jgi:hypothetical protein
MHKKALLLLLALCAGSALATASLLHFILIKWVLAVLRGGKNPGTNKNVPSSKTI